MDVERLSRRHCHRIEWGVTRAGSTFTLADQNSDSNHKRVPISAKVDVQSDTRGTRSQNEREIDYSVQSIAFDTSRHLVSGIVWHASRVASTVISFKGNGGAVRLRVNAAPFREFARLLSVRAASYLAVPQQASTEGVCGLLTFDGRLRLSHLDDIQVCNKRVNERSVQRLERPVGMRFRSDAHVT
jgi:hypothetical protein